MSRIGVVGTLVWDTIHPPPGSDASVVEEWGGIAYALAAFEAVLAPTWSVLPLIKVGDDLAERAVGLLGGYRCVATLDGVKIVGERNNRVELFYEDREDRCEKLTGGVPGWRWEELAPLARSCDLLYVNFIAGWELDLDTARQMRKEFRGLIYCDVHSLLLGVADDGVRVRRPLRDRSAWLSSFQALQVNRGELDTLVPGGGEPLSKARALLDEGPEVVLVTQGPEGAAWVARADAELLGGAPAVGALEAEPGGSRVDPTGCGDVWGAVCCAGIARGAPLDEAVRLANRLAGANASWRGTRGLAGHLRAAAGIPA